MKNTMVVPNPLYQESQSFHKSPLQSSIQVSLARIRTIFLGEMVLKNGSILFQEKKKLKNHVCGFLVFKVQKRKEDADRVCWSRVLLERCLTRFPFAKALPCVSLLFYGWVGPCDQFWLVNCEGGGPDQSAFNSDIRPPRTLFFLAW